MNRYILIIAMWLCIMLGANAAEHTLRLKAVPAFACSFNFTEQTVEAGENVRIEIKVNNTDSRIKLTIKDQDDSEVQLSNYTKSDQLHTGDFLMPDADVTLTVYLNYTPSGLPGDPGILQYSAATKSLTLTSPTPRTLSDNIANALKAKGISRSDVEHLRVIGKVEPYDIGYDNYELRYMTKLKTLDLSGATLVPGDYGRTSVYGSFSYSESYKYDLEDILLPQGVTEYSSIFHYCPKIKTVTISDLVPPTLQNDEYSFSEMSEDAILYVPDEALGAYLGFTGWSYKFSNIRVKDMNVLKLTLPYDAADGRYNGRRMRFHDKDNGTDMYRPITDKLSYTISCPEGSHWDAYIVNGSDQILSTISDITITGEETAVTFPPTVDPPADLKFDTRDYEKVWPQDITKQVTFTAEVGDVITFDTHYYAPNGYYPPRCKIYLGSWDGPTVYNKYERADEVVDETVQYLVTEDGFVNFYIEYDWNSEASYFVVDNFKIQHQWGAPSEYKQKLIDAVAEVEDVCDPAVLAEARDLIENMPAADAEILSMKADIKDLYARLRQYIVVDLGEQPGTLASRLEATQVKLDEIIEFKLKGKMNNADFLTLQGITNSNTLDLTDAYCVEFNLKEQVRITNRNITEFAVPEGLEVINYISLYDAVGLKHLIIPSTATYLSISPSYYGSFQKTTIKAALPPRVDPYTSLRGSIYVPKKSIELYRSQLGDSYNYYAIDEEDDSWPVELNAGLPRTITTEDIAADGIQHNMLVPLNYDRSISQTPGAISIDGTAPVNFGEFTFWQTNYGLPSFTSRLNTARSEVICPAFVSNAPLTADRVSLLWRPHYRINGELTFYTPPMDINVADMVPTHPGDFIAVYTYSGEKRASGSASNWVQVPFDGIMHSGQGYAIYYAYNDITYNYSPVRLTSTEENRNDIFRTDNVSVPLAAYPSTETWNAHWNFVGNPYPACFDVTYLDTESPIVVFAPGGYYGNYMYFTVSPADGDHYVLGPGEAFFIQTDGEATELTFNKEGRQLNYKMRDIASGARRVAGNGRRSIFNLQILNAEGTELDRTRVVVNPDAKVDYEHGRDVAKFTNDNPDDEVLYTTLNGGTRLSLNERPLADGRFPLGADLKAGNTYTLRLANTVNAGNMTAYIEDTVTGTLTPISDTDGYTFTATADSARRLVLHISADGITGIQNVNGTSTANESIYDLTGRRVSNTRSNGIYIIKNKKVVF